MTQAAGNREFIDGLATACDNLGKLSGLAWKVESLGDPSADAQQELVEGVRMGVSSRLAPRFLLAASQADIKIIVEKVAATYGIGAMDGVLVLSEIANIIFSDILNRMSVAMGEHLIVSTPQKTSGSRTDLLAALSAGRGGRMVRARLAGSGAVSARLDILAAFD
jgi:hypothetical protein